MIYFFLIYSFLSFSPQEIVRKDSIPEFAIINVLLNKVNENGALFRENADIKQNDTICIYYNEKYWLINDTIFTLPHSNKIIILTNSNCRSRIPLLQFEVISKDAFRYKYTFIKADDEYWEYYHVLFKKRQLLPSGNVTFQYCRAELLNTKTKLHINNISSNEFFY